MPPKLKKEHDPAVEGVLQYLQEREEGVPQQELLDNGMPDLAPQQRITLLNQLLSTKKVEILQDAAGNYVFKISKEPPDPRMATLNKEDVMVYQRIKEAGNKGIWTRDLKLQTNLAQPQVTKVLKVLEGQGLVKAVKSVANPSRKLYILADIEPAREITGGAWYSDTQFDSQFVHVLREACFKCIETRPNFPTLSEIAAFIRSINISRVALQDDDIRQIVDTLIYDGRVEQIAGEEEDTYRQAVLEIPEATALSSMPCGRCPVMDQCRDGGEVSPQTCVYYKTWLEF